MQATRDPRLPPGQYDTGRQWPVLTAEVTPKIAADRRGRSPSRANVEQPATWTWDEMHALPPSTYHGDIHCVTTWSKLGMEFEGVSVDTLLAAARPLPGVHATCSRSRRPATRPTCRSPTSPTARPGSRSPPTASRCPATTAGPPASWSPTCTSGRARSGCPGSACSTTTNPGSGSERVPRPRRSLARAALPGRLTVPATWQTATVRRHPRRDADRQDLPARARLHHRPPRRAALRGAAHRARRLHRVAFVLGRVGARRVGRDRAHGRAPRGR